MSHRLRRVIGVNIRNPRDGGTSMRFAQLDTRGAVMAVGPNGVGKTSFLRLIPLFYGALPSRILRGSGHTSMIRHILPDPTSAVVYEYERERNTDLRCVVMHAAPEGDIDAPIFHIISAGFKEDFLTDAEGNFLRRDEFKSHVQELGLEVSQQLSLSQYRSVILNSVGLTKDAVKFRRLAAQHSLSPGTLHGLDQIAAAMGPEAISFQVLQEIVVDQVALELSGDGRMTRELRKSGADVMKWLEAYDHLSKLQARAEEGRKLGQHCAEIEAIDSELRELRRAVSELLATLKEDKERAGRDTERVRTEGIDEQQRLADAAGAAERAWQELKGSVADLQDTVGRTQRRKTYFDELGGVGAVALEVEHRQEVLVRAEVGRLQREQEELQKRARGIVDSYAQRSTRIRHQLAEDEKRIGEAIAMLAKAHVQRMEDLRLQEQQAVDGLKPPARIGDIRGEIERRTAAINLLRGELKNPAASDETLADLAAVQDKLPEARRASKAAERARDEARDQLASHGRERDELLRAHERASDRLETARHAVHGLEQQLKPPPGSLLAFMRSARFPSRCQVAKVIDPQLLNRTDLQPQEVADAPEVTGHAVAIGPLMLHLQEVAEPEWLEATSVRDQLQRAQGRANSEGAAVTDLEGKLRATESRMGQLSHGLAQREAELKARSGDVERLDGNERDLRAAVAQEIHVRRAEIGAQIQELAEESQELGKELARLSTEFANAGTRITDDFESRRQLALEEQKIEEARLEQEKTDTAARADADLKLLADEEREELKAADVDTERLNDVRQGLGDAQARLARIIEMKEEISAWRKFRDGELANLPMVQEQLRTAEQNRDYAYGRHSRAHEALEQHAKEVREQLLALEERVERLQDDIARLEALLLQELHVIGEPRRATTVQTRSADELAIAVASGRRRLVDAISQADDLHRSLRNQMLGAREGPVQDWLAQREAELAPLLEGLPDHLATMHRGRLIAQWYEGASSDAINALHIELNGVLAIAAGFVTFLDTFDRKVAATNTELRGQLGSVKPFPAFRDLDVHIRSSVRELDYMDALRKMKELSESQVSMHRFSGRIARQTELPGQEVVHLMRTFRDLLNRENGIRANLSELVRLECSLTINGKPLRIGDAEEFKRHASNGTTGMIIGMFLMGFAGVVRKRAQAPVRVTWITDEVGRFDSVNLQSFLETLDGNNIDVISARPEADPTTLDLFDTEAKFGLNGKISTIRLGVDEWEAQDVAA